MRRPRITKAIADELGGLAGAFEENAKAGRPEITGDDLAGAGDAYVGCKTHQDVLRVDQAIDYAGELLRYLAKRTIK